MKHEDLKPCAFCKKGMMHNGTPLFYRLNIQRYCVDMRAVQRQAGLEQMMGNHILAHVMGPNEDLAKPLGEKFDLLICQDCAIEPQMIAMLTEKE
jgi:hypothetical protein